MKINILWAVVQSWNFADFDLYIGRETGKLINVGFPQCKTIKTPLIFQSPVPLSLVVGVACAMLSDVLSAPRFLVDVFSFVKRCSRCFSSRRSRSRGGLVENIPRRGFAATCCSCVSFAWEIVRDSLMVNIVSQTMNKQNSLSWIIHENAPGSSAAKSMLPGNAKFSMTKRYVTSLADTKYTFIALWGIEFCSWLIPRAISRLRDEIIKSLRSE